MPVKTSFVTEQYIRSVQLPNHGKTYSVIPHGHIIDQTKQELSNAGFEVTQELYKCTLDGQIAQGIYHLNFGNDPDMGLMFAWSNSYNKTMRFKCGVGAHVFVCMNGMLAGDLASYRRKHTGSALYEANLHIQEQIANAASHYNLLIKDKELLKNIILTPKEKGTILGRLFAEQEILTLTQVGIVKRELDKPSFSYNANPDSAWAMYNHVTYALKDSHPQSYLQDHQTVHQFFIDEFGKLTAANISHYIVEPTPQEQLSLQLPTEPVFEVNAEPELTHGVVFL